MTTTRWLFGLAVVLMAIAMPLMFACSSAAPTSAPQNVSVSPTPLQNAWEDTVKAAQQEGTVNIYATAMSPAIGPLREAFKQKYGVNLEFVEGRPPEVMAKIKAERQAGLYLVDVGHLGETTSMMDVKPLKIVSPLSDLMVLEDVKNPRSWIGTVVPFLDKEHQVLMFTAMAITPGVINTDMVKAGDISSWLDLLKPEWKGKIVFSDPSVSGGSPNMLASLVKTFGKDRTIEILGQLAAQEPMLTRDQRLLQEWVARGKYPVGLGASIGLITEFKAAGAHIDPLKLKEPRHISGGPGNLVVFNDNPHPKATKLYVNWLLGKEAQSIWSKALGYPSMRTDVGGEGLDPATLPRADDVFPNEEQMQLRVEMRTLSAKIFGSAAQ